MRVLLALTIALTIFAVVWLAQDWFNALLNSSPITFEPDSVALGIVTWALIPIILLFNMLALPGVLVVAVLEPLCGCGHAVAGPVLIASAMLCGLTSGGLWLYRRRS